MKNKKGITIVEMIVVIALIVMVLAIVGSFMKFSFISQKTSADEYKIQGDMRLATDIINNQIRNATVAFTLPQGKFVEAPLAKNKIWSYFGVENNKDIVQYYSDGTTQTKRILFTAAEGVSYNLNFVKNTNNTKLLEYTLVASFDSNNKSKITISSKVEALNSIAVDEGGSIDTPAVAIAYKTDPIPTAQRSTVAVALVLDNSGSMDFIMGGTGADKNEYRKDILKQQAVKLINTFSSMGNVNVCVIPFSNNANSTNGWKDSTVLADKTSIISAINGITGDGGTNTGDGMRRAYYSLQSFDALPANSGKTVLNYMILLTDGNPTYYSGTTDPNDWHHPAYIAQTNGNNAAYIWGDGGESTSNINVSMNYVNTIGQTLTVGQTIDIKSYAIALTGLSTEVTRVRSIAESACTTTNLTLHPSRIGKYFLAASSDDLAAAFKDISNTVLADQWHISGPY